MKAFAERSPQNVRTEAPLTKSILLIENDLHNATWLREYLVSKGYDVSIATDELEILRILRSQTIVGIFLSMDDSLVPHLELIKSIRVQYCKIPIIIMATEINRTEMQNAFLEGVKGCVFKPFVYDQIQETLFIFEGHLVNQKVTSAKDTA